jgi:hypothetical protein
MEHTAALRQAKIRRVTSTIQSCLTSFCRQHYINSMTRTQIQLPEPLFQRLKTIAVMRDWSVAELIRRGMETYVQTCPEVTPQATPWTMPVLRRSGGHLLDPASVRPETEAIESRNPKA